MAVFVLASACFGMFEVARGQIPFAEVRQHQSFSTAEPGDEHKASPLRRGARGDDLRHNTPERLDDALTQGMCPSFGVSGRTAGLAAEPRAGRPPAEPGDEARPGAEPGDEAGAEHPLAERDDEEDTRLRFSSIIIPASFYSPVLGFGVGLGVGLQNIVGPGSVWAVTFEPQQHRGYYTTYLRTHDPDVSPVFGFFRAAYELNGRRGFFGIGPDSHRDHSHFLRHEGWLVETRIGFQFLENRFVVQPIAAYEWHRTHNFRPRMEGAFEGLDELSRQNLLSIAGRGRDAVPGPSQHGISYGLHAALDTRDRKAYPTSGVVLQGMATRFDELDGDIRFDSFLGGAHAFFRAGGNNVLALRASSILVRSRFDGILPLYFLPVLDVRMMGGYERYRFTGNDVLYLNAEYRTELFNLLEIVQSHAFVHAALGNAYRNVFDEFDFRVSFSREIEERNGRYPLRPAVSLGGRLEWLMDDETWLEGLVGLTPEGITIYGFKFVYDLRMRRHPAR